MSSSDHLSVAVDIGGTFTDVTFQNPATGPAWRAKTPSIPSDPSQAFINGVRLALESAGAQASSINRVLHGTTVATNMILEGKGARAALVTTSSWIMGIHRFPDRRRASPRSPLRTEARRGG